MLTMISADDARREPESASQAPEVRDAALFDALRSGLAGSRHVSDPRWSTSRFALHQSEAVSAARA